jgi:FAD/FMN-containing dehydrogenase
MKEPLVSWLYAQTLPGGQRCKAAARGPDTTACEAQLERSSTTEFWPQQFSGGTITTGFLGSPPLQRSEYFVAAESTSDIAATVSFAAAHNLRLVIKGTGHDFLARGNARSPGTLMLWTHRMQGIAWSTDGAHTVTLAAGVRWGDAYDSAQQRGRFVLGGHCESVGAVGGFPAAGGWGSFSRAFGTAADNMLSAEVVTADGAVSTVSEGARPELFFALRGGGGGTFAAVSSITCPRPPGAVKRH